MMGEMKPHNLSWFVAFARKHDQHPQADWLQAFIDARTPPTNQGAGKPVTAPGWAREVMGKLRPIHGIAKNHFVWNGKDVGKVIREVVKACEHALSAAPPAPASDHVGAVGSAEREVGRYVYMLIEARMNAAPGTPEGRELSYLADIVADVEEYGAHELMGVDDFTDPSPHFAEAPPSPDHAALVGPLERIIGLMRDYAIAAGALDDDDVQAISDARTALSRLAAALHPSAEGGCSVGLSAEASAPSRVSDADSEITNGES